MNATLTQTCTCKRCDETMDRDDFVMATGLCLECDAATHDEAWEAVTRLLDREDKAVEVLAALKAAGLL